MKCRSLGGSVFTSHVNHHSLRSRDSLLPGSPAMFLYQLRDLQLAALTPWHLMASATKTLLENPLCPLGQTPLGRGMAETLANLWHSTRPYTKPPFGIDSITFRGETVAVRERTADLTPFCRLIHFLRAPDKIHLAERAEKDPKVLLIPPFSGHFCAVMRDTIKAMLPSHNLFVTDWTDAKMVPLAFGSFDLEDQISYLIRILRLLGEDSHIVAISQASIPALAAVALLAGADKPFEPRSLTLIGGPIDVNRASSPLSEVALTHPLTWFKETQIQYVPSYYPGAFRSVYPGFMRLRNRMALVSDKKITEERKYFDHLTRGIEEKGEALEDLYDLFLSVMDVPAELYLQFVKRAYQQASLANDTFVWQGRKVDLRAIRYTALLTVEAELDDLSPPGQTQAALDLCSSLPDRMKKAHLEIGVGHYGVFTGRKWRNNIQPVIHGFIRQYSLSARETESCSL